MADRDPVRRAPTTASAPSIRLVASDHDPVAMLRPLGRRRTDAVHPALLLFPCNGNAVEAIDCIGSTYQLMGFVSDAPPREAYVRLGYPIWSRQALRDQPDARVLAVPGSADTYLQRVAVINELHLERERFACLIHSRAAISPMTRIGCNVLILAGAVVTSNARIGDHVCILANTVVHHDTTIGSWTLIGSNVTIAGGVTVGENCYIGSGSAIKNGVRIADRTLVGLGSVVLHDTLPGSVMAGNPARRLR